MVHGQRHPAVVASDVQYFGTRVYLFVCVQTDLFFDIFRTVKVEMHSMLFTPFGVISKLADMFVCHFVR